MQAQRDAAEANAALAARHTRIIQASLQAARTADERAANRLRSIQVPEVIIAEAAQTVQRIAGTPMDGDTSGLPVQFPAGWKPSDYIREIDQGQWLELMRANRCQFSIIPFSDNLTSEESKYTGYLGGGSIIGPDGNEYPLVMPRLIEDGVAYGADAETRRDRVEDLGGSDSGWVLTGQTSGVDMLMPVGLGTKLAAGAGALAGAAYKSPFEARPELAEKLSVDRNGVPSLQDGPESLAGPGRPFDDPRENPWDNPPTQPLNSMEKLGGTVDIVTNVGEGAIVWRDLSDSEDRLYTLRLEENEDGRRRALLRTYDVYENLTAGRDAPKFEIRSSYGYFDEPRDKFDLLGYNIRGAEETPVYRQMKMGD